jgi:hypothetical protein
MAGGKEIKRALEKSLRERQQCTYEWVSEWVRPENDMMCKIQWKSIYFFDVEKLLSLTFVQQTAVSSTSNQQMSSEGRIMKKIDGIKSKYENDIFLFSFRYYYNYNISKWVSVCGAQKYKKAYNKIHADEH